MKKILVSIMVLTLSFSLIACGGTEGSSSSEAQGQTAQAETIEKESKEENNDMQIKVGDELITGDFAVRINSLRKVEDMDGNPSVVVNYSFTNNSEDTISPMVAIYMKIFQDGTQLENAIIFEGISLDNSMKELRPGTSIDDCETGFVMISENELEIEVIATSEMFSGKPVLVITDAPQ